MKRVLLFVVLLALSLEQNLSASLAEHSRPNHEIHNKIPPITYARISENNKQLQPNVRNIFQERRMGRSSEKAHIEDSTVNLPSPRSDLTTALALAPDDDGVLTMGIYLMGGCDHYNANKDGLHECVSVTNNMWVYEPYRDMFITRKPIPIARYRHVSSSINGDTIWVLTGRDEFHNLIAQIDVYTPERDSWVTLPATLPPELQISDGAVFSRGTSLYVVGGYNAQYEATGQAFEIDTEATIEQGVLVYSILEPMGTPRGDVSAILFQRHAYIVGGFTHTNGFCAPLATTEVYDLVKNEWYDGPDLNIGRGDVSLVSFNGRIFALGGETTHLNPRSASCMGGRSESINYMNKLVAKTYPVNSIEMITPDQDEDHKKGWKLAYKDFLPPDNDVFRFVANAFPENNVIYTFGGLFYHGGESETTTEWLRTSDRVTLYVDDFKNGRFHGNSFGSSHFSPFEDWNSLQGGQSSFVVITLSILMIVSAGAVIAAKRMKMKEQNEMKHGVHSDEDAIGLVEEENALT